MQAQAIIHSADKKRLKKKMNKKYYSRSKMKTICSFEYIGKATGEREEGPPKTNGVCKLASLSLARKRLWIQHEGREIRNYLLTLGLLPPRFSRRQKAFEIRSLDTVSEIESDGFRIKIGGYNVTVVFWIVAVTVF